MMTRYALIDNYSGYIWGVANATSAIDAARVVDTDIGGDPREYEEVSRFDFANSSGYHVYEVPAGYDVDDGQSRNEIARLEEVGRHVACISFETTD
jgi:hypothetical protein